MNVPQTFDDLVAFAHAMVAVGRCDAGAAARVVLDELLVDYDNSIWRALDMAMDPTYYNDWPTEGIAGMQPTIRKGRNEYEAWILSQQTA